MPLGGGVCLSIGWQFAGMPAELAALTLAVGVAVRRVLQRVAGLDIALKWPNDLVVDERKLGGILLELVAEAQGGAHVVAGIGLNVALPPELLPSLSDWPRGAIDLKTALGREPPPRAVLAGSLVERACGAVQRLSRPAASRRIEASGGPPTTSAAAPCSSTTRRGPSSARHSASMRTARCWSRRQRASSAASSPATSACGAADDAARRRRQHAYQVGDARATAGS